MRLLEALLEFAFPPSFRITKPDATPGEDLKTWMRYEAANYTEHDPFRPMGIYDSWAGKVREKR